MIISEEQLQEIVDPTPQSEYYKYSLDASIVPYLRGLPGKIDATPGTALLDALHYNVPIRQLEPEQHAKSVLQFASDDESNVDIELLLDEPQEKLKIRFSSQPTVDKPPARKETMQLKVPSNKLYKSKSYSYGHRHPKK